jgi:hypothetical protein
MLYWRVLPWLALFLENTNALIAPTRFLAWVSYIRAGFRIPFGDSGLEVIAALHWYSAQIEDYEDHYGGSVTPGHPWDQASWTGMGLEFGLSFWY